MSPPRPSTADMVVDTSAVIAVLRNESTAERVTEVLRRAAGPIMSAPTRLELSIVAAANATDQRAGAQSALALLDAARIVTIPVDETLADIGFDAWSRFGKGNHPARLNYGDLFSFALASHWDLPLLCVGDDFRHTELELIDVNA